MIRFRFLPTLEDWFAFNRIVVLRQFRFLNVLALVILEVFLIYPFALRPADRENQCHYFPEAIVPDIKALEALLAEHVMSRGRSAR